METGKVWATIPATNETVTGLGIELQPGDIVQQVDYNVDGSIVLYGIPGEGHDCDAMGCPTAGHVLGVKKVNAKPELISDASEVTGIHDFTGGVDPVEHVRNMRD